MRNFTNVLLVEDDPITVLVCDRIIKMTGFASNVSSCENGKTAIDRLATLTETGQEIPEVIFLDINMPVMNGWDFLAAFEKMHPQINQPPRIYILSSTIDPEDYKKAKSFALVEDFISKPLSKESLEKIT
jgi:CheY-like chemotaxis protein